jgi:hypothetical protein
MWRLTRTKRWQRTRQEACTQCTRSLQRHPIPLTRCRSYSPDMNPSRNFVDSSCGTSYSSPCLRHRSRRYRSIRMRFAQKFGGSCNPACRERQGTCRPTRRCSRRARTGPAAGARHATSRRCCSRRAGARWSNPLAQALAPHSPDICRASPSPAARRGLPSRPCLRTRRAQGSDPGRRPAGCGEGGSFRPKSRTGTTCFWRCDTQRP